MSLMQTLCPDCRTRLRLPEKTRIEEPFECPECSQSLVLTQLESGKIKIRLWDKQETKQSDDSNVSGESPSVREDEKAVPVEKKQPVKTNFVVRLAASFHRALQSPFAFVWLMAAVVMLLFTVLVLSPFFANWSYKEVQHQAKLDQSQELNEKPKPKLTPNGEKPPGKISDPKKPVAVLEKRPLIPPVIPPLPEPEIPKVIPKKEPPKIAVNPPVQKPDPKVKPLQLPANLKERLSQKIQRFEQKEAVSIERLLVELEVLLGVRIEAVKGDAAVTQILRDTKIKLTKERTSAGEILAEVLKKGGLTYSVGRDRFYVERIKQP